MKRVIDSWRYPAGKNAFLKKHRLFNIKGVKLGMRCAKVQYVDFNRYDRIIVISDIHGDPDGFIGVLNQVAFSDTDVLVIVGDILGKGHRCLELLQMVTDQAEKGNLYMVTGNHDVVLSEWYRGEITDEDMCAYFNSGATNIVTEMAQALHLHYHALDDVKNLKAEIRKSFAREIEFLEQLPQIIDSKAAIFVHAGIKPGSLYNQEYRYCLTAPAFAEQTYCFEKPVITGHWPASNYSDRVIDANVYFNRNNNVVSIDGGNSMKYWAQINYLILDSEGNNLQSGYYDALPKIKALDAQKETIDPITLIFPKTRIEVREVMDKESICYVPYLNRELTIDNDRIYKYKVNVYCYDFTTYCLPVAAGEILSLCEEQEDGILVKRDGIVGKYYGCYEYVY